MKRENHNSSKTPVRIALAAILFLVVAGIATSLSRSGGEEVKVGVRAQPATKLAPLAKAAMAPGEREAPGYFVSADPAKSYNWDIKTSPFLTIGGEATLDFGSRKVAFIVEIIDTKGVNHFVVTGRSVGNPNPAKDVIVSFKNGVMIANAYLPEGAFAIAPKSKGEWFVGKVENAPLCGSCSPSLAVSGPQADLLPPPISQDHESASLIDTSRIITTSGPVIDILAYIDQDLIDQIGADAVAAYVDICEASFNTAAENSQMLTRLRIAKTKAIKAPWKLLNKTTGEPIAINLNAMMASNGGFENIAAETRLAGADFPFMLCATDWTRNIASGYALSTYTFDAQGNATTSRGSWGVATYDIGVGETFAHEVGHMLGCNHDRSLYTSTYTQTKFSDPARDYNYAWSEGSGRWNDTNGIATLMSGIGAGLLYFSNPNVQYIENWNTYENDTPHPHSMTHQMGRPIGTAEAAYDAKFVDEATAPFAAAINPSLVPAYAAGHFIGLSTRSLIGNGDGAMIGGFVIEGSTPKKVMVRALGPSLAAQGVLGVATNPKLALSYYNQASWVQVAQNDDWVNASNQAELAATDFKPSSLVEPGLVITLAPGPYSAVIQPQDGIQGVGMVEVYELPDTGNAQMVDVATRALVGTGNNALFGGFVIDCPAGKKKSVLLRGLGPSLTAQGVPGALQDPIIKVYDMNKSPAVLIATSDDWSTEASAARVANQPYIPASPREAATVLDLPAGVYSVVLEPKDGVQGVGMVEVYQMADTTPPPLQALPPGSIYSY